MTQNHFSGKAHSQLFDGLDLQTSLAAAGVQNDDLTFQLGSSRVSFGKALYQHLQANHPLLRALPFTAVVAASVAPPPPPVERPLWTPEPAARQEAVPLPLFG